MVIAGYIRPRWERLRASAFVQNSLAYTGSNMLGQAASFLSGMALRRIFPPAIMGFWNLRGVAQGVLSTFDLGAELGASRELPLLAGQGRPPGELSQCRSTAFWFALLQSAAITSAWFAYLALRRARYSPLELNVMVVSGALFILADLQAVYTVFFRSAQAYRPLSRLLLYFSLAEAALMPAAAFWGGLGAVFVAAIALAAARLARFAAVARRAGAGVGFSFSRPLLIRLVKFGATMRIVEYPGSIAALLPVLLVTKRMRLEDLALYSLAAGLAGQVGDVSARISTVFMTRFLEKVGGGAAVRSQAGELLRFLTFQLLVVVPLLCWAGGAGLPLLVRLFIPKYEGAVGACLILLVSTFFLTINSGLTIFWTSTGTLWRRGAADLAGLCLMALSLGFVRFVLQDRTIEGVAWGAVLGSAGYFATMVFSVGRELWPLRISLLIVLGVAAAAGWTFAVLRYMAPAAALNAAVGLAAMAPLVAFGAWRSKILS